MTEADIEDLVDLPITPLGLAGIYVGEDVDAVVARIGEPESRHPLTNAPGDTTDVLEYGPFVIVADRGRVDAVWAIEGYRGETLGGVGVGMPWLELVRRCPDVTYSEVHAAWCVPGWPYMAIEVSRPSRTEEEAELNGPWTEEWYEVSDPEHAFISLISLGLQSEPLAAETAVESE